MIAKRTQIGAWIRERRESLHLTQQQLADIIWCTSSCISKIERGQSSIVHTRFSTSKSKRTGIRLADALSLDDDDRVTFLEMLGRSDYAKYNRASSIIGWRKNVPLLVN